MRIWCSSVVLLSTVSVYAAEPMIVAHRGASKDAPENTLPAFKLAFKQGADAIEGEFHLTRDGHVVCIHDRDTRKVSKTNLRVSSSTLAELRVLDVGVKKGERFKGTKIPTIAEVFATIPDNKTIYIEIKCGAEIIPPLLRDIGKSGLKREQIVVICFDASLLQKLKALAPYLKVSWLCSIKRNRKTKKITPSIDQVLTKLKSIESDGFSSSTGIPAEYVQSIGEQGYEWHVWTVNDEKTARRMKALGARSITTDVPARMRKYIAD